MTADNPLQALFLRAWSTEGFATAVAARPHDALAEHGLAVSRDVAVAVHGWREEAAHLCWDCQLAVPGVYVRLVATTHAEPLSPLDALFVRARDPDFVARASTAPRETIAELGLALSANVRIEIRVSDGPPSLELQLCEGYHACLCATPELSPVVFATWKPG